MTRRTLGLSLLNLLAISIILLSFLTNSVDVNTQLSTFVGTIVVLMVALVYLAWRIDSSGTSS